MLTKIKAIIGRPTTESMFVKKMQDDVLFEASKVYELPWMMFFFILDRVDLLYLIIIHQLPKDYAMINDYENIYQCVYERIYNDYYNQLNVPKAKKKKQKCICQ